MNDTWYVQKGVELAEGWQWADYGDGDVQLECADGAWWHCDDDPVTPDDFPRILKDALAAQLVRQVDALSPHYHIVQFKWTHGKQDPRTELHGLPSPVSSMTKLLVRVDGKDRTMNTIRCIVDSKVLQDDGK